MPPVPGTGSRWRSWATAPGIGGSVICLIMICAGRTPAAVGTVPSG